MLDQTTQPTTADIVALPSVDIPAEATVLRIEPQLDDADHLKGIPIVYITDILYLDGSREFLPGAWKTGTKSHPYSERALRKPVASVKTILVSGDGPLRVAVRTTAGTAEAMPARLAYSAEVATEIEKRYPPQPVKERKPGNVRLAGR